MHIYVVGFEDTEPVCAKQCETLAEATGLAGVSEYPSLIVEAESYFDAFIKAAGVYNG